MPKPYPQPRIYTTAEWGARPSGPFSTVPISKWLLHHMDTQNVQLAQTHDLAVAHAFQIARDCQALHMDTNGWSDTGQQFTVTRDGIILEGRHGSIGAILNRVNVLGAQCAGFNSESGGTEHEGEYDEEHMPLPQWNASVDLHSWIVDRTGIDSTDIDGHRDHVSTDCPGAWLYSQLPKFRQAVHSKLAVWRKANP